MTMPPHAKSVFDACKTLTPERKSVLYEHLAQTLDERRNETISVLIQNGGPEGRIVAEIFGKETRGPRDAKMNKMASVPGGKSGE